MERILLPEKFLECSRRFTNTESCIDTLKAETWNILNKLYLENINDTEVAKCECVEIELDYIHQIINKVEKRLEELKEIIDEHKHYWDNYE